MSKRIACVLEGTGQTRLVSAENGIIYRLEDQINPYLTQGEPIQILSAGGGRKDKCDESEQKLDIAELTTLSTLSVLNEVIKSIYDPGMKFIIVNEDVGDKYLFRHSVVDIDEQTDVYTQKLITLSKSLECIHGGSINPVNESHILNQSGISPQDFIEQCDKILPIFLSYIQESDQMNNADPEDWKNLESYKKLKQLGWLGVIPQEMRDFYYSRIELIHGGNRQLQQVNLAQMFAAILKRKELGVTDFRLDEGEQIPLRMSFATPTPGMPTKGGRIFLRSIPRKINSSRMPYWVGNGILRKQGDQLQPQIISRYTQNTNVRPNSLEISGIRDQIEANIVF